MEVLGGHLRSATDSITSATQSGDWSEAVFERIAVDSDDQIGEAGRAFNSLLGAVEGRKDLEERLRYQAFHDHAHRSAQPRLLHGQARRGRGPASGGRHAVGGALPRRGQPEGGQRQPGPRRRRHPHQAAQRAHGEQRPGHRHRRPPLRRRVRHPADRARQRAPGRARGAPHDRLPARADARSASTSCAPGSASAWPRRPPARPVASACCAPPTWPCTPPRPAARAGSRSSSPATTPPHVERDAVRAELSGALDAEQLELHYQPIVDV